MKRITVALALALVIMGTIGVGGASADPINTREDEVFEITCEGIDETFQIVTTSGNPGHILGSTSVIIPMEFTFTATFTDPETGELATFSETESVGQGLKKGLQDDLVTCVTEPMTFVEPGMGEVTFMVAVEAFITPRGQ